MKKTAILITLLINILFSASAAVESPRQLIVAPGTLSSSSATLVWDKPEHYGTITRYHIILYGKDIATSNKCSYTPLNLLPVTKYKCSILAEDKDGNLSAPSPTVSFVTRHKGKIVDVTQFGAKGDGVTLNTVFIQKAIDQCPTGGTVLIPKGLFLSGALFLKSHMTLLIKAGGELKGSTNEADYRPFINNRFEGWEMKTYASLLNAGTMDRKGGFSVERLSIRGEGTITGGGTPLANKMIEKDGLRSRGRLICLMNCRDVEIQ
ncbi:MAG: glycosyl hydrolase family 28-related protein, partial [Bacteroidota bacterium]|nr:glycosyl hydrolase family 28-related protein [Bacteroidota bacterium]